MAVGPRLQRQADEVAVVSIVGERGAGKTTILRESLRRLENECVVLSPILPEYFAGGETVLGAAIAALGKAINGRHPGVMESPVSPGETATFNTLLDRLLRRAGVIGRGSEDGLQQSSLDAAASDFALAASIGSVFVDQWADFVRALNAVLREHTGRGWPILVPIDDPDLAPNILQRVLADSRLLTAAQGVIVVVCLDIEEARRALSESYLSAYPNLRGRLTRDDELVPTSIADAQLAKALPQSSRILVRDLSVAERLDFKPLRGGRETLSDLMRQFALPGRGAPDASLGALVEFSGRPTPFSQCLSANPRDLEGLHYAFQRAKLRDGLPGTQAAAQEFLTHGLRYGLRRSPAVPLHVDDLIGFDESGGATTLTLRLDQIEVFTRGEFRGRTLYSRHLPPGSYIRLSEIGWVFAEFGRGREGGDGPRLHSAVCSAVLLARELSYSYAVFLEELSGGRPIKGGAKPTGAVELRIGRDNTDDLFFMFPQWEGYLDYFLVAEGWSMVLQELQKHVSTLDEPLLMAAAAIEWWRLHLAVQRSRKLPQGVGGAFSRLSGRDPEAALRREARSTWRRISELYASESDRGSVRARDFTVWVETYAFGVCHPALVPSWFIEETWSARGAALDKVGRRSSADSALLYFINQRVRRYMGEAWIEPLMDLMALIDPGEAAESWRIHRSTIEARNATRLRRMGAAGVGAAPDPDVAFKAAMDALSELQRDAEARAATMPGR